MHCRRPLQPNPRNGGRGKPMSWQVYAVKAGAPMRFGIADFAHTFRLALMIALLIGVSSTVFAQEEPQEEAARAEAVKLEILMGEMFFQLEGQEPNATITLAAGITYAITLRNIGVVKHEAVFGHDLVKTEGIPIDFSTYLFGDVEVMITGDDWEVEALGTREIELVAGHEAELLVTIPEDASGEWEIACFIPGHYQAGMRIPLEID